MESIFRVTSSSLTKEEVLSSEFSCVTVAVRDLTVESGALAIVVAMQATFLSSKLN